MKYSSDKLAILVCVFNRQELLSRQLRHIEKELSGVDLDFSIFVLDDCSADPIYIEESYFFNVHLFRSDINLGLIEARNHLIKMTKDMFSYLLFLDDDLFIFNLHKYITEAVSAIKSGYSIAYCPYINLPLADKGSIENFKYIYNFRSNSKDVANFNGGASLFDSNIFNEIGLFYGPYKIYLEEEDFCIRMISKGNRSARLFGYNFIGVHDQPPGKIKKERLVFLLSNRMIFHYRFIESSVIRVSLNILYYALYFHKTRDMDVIRRAINRYNASIASTPRVPISTAMFVKFFIYRYFNISPRPHTSNRRIQE